MCVYVCVLLINSFNLLAKFRFYSCFSFRNFTDTISIVNCTMMMFTHDKPDNDTEKNKKKLSHNMKIKAGFGKEYIFFKK